MWPSWLLSLAGTAEAGGLGRRVMENIQAYLFKTSAHLNATRGFGAFTSCSDSERELLLQKAAQLGSRTCSISPLLPHFNPKQSEVIKCQQVVHSFEPSWSTRWVGFTQLEQSRQRHRVFNSQFFPVMAKTFWHHSVNVSSLWPQNKTNVIIKVRRWNIDTGIVDNYVCAEVNI